MQYELSVKFNNIETLVNALRENRDNGNFDSLKDPELGMFFIDGQEVSGKVEYIGGDE